MNNRLSRSTQCDTVSDDLKEKNKMEFGRENSLEMKMEGHKIQMAIKSHGYQYNHHTRIKSGQIECITE